MKKTNPRITGLINNLSGKEEKIWKDLALRLSKPGKTVVNVARIGRYAKKGENLIVPGKVLGYGNIGTPVFVGALSFSKEAEEKIKKAGGSCTRIEEVVKENPKGKKVRLFG